MMIMLFGPITHMLLTPERSETIALFCKHSMILLHKMCLDCYIPTSEIYVNIWGSGTLLEGNSTVL